MANRGSRVVFLESMKSSFFRGWNGGVASREFVCKAIYGSWWFVGHPILAPWVRISLVEIGRGALGTAVRRLLMTLCLPWFLMALRLAQEALPAVRRLLMTLCLPWFLMALRLAQEALPAVLHSPSTMRRWSWC